MDNQAEILSNTYGSERNSCFIRLPGGPTTLEKSPGGMMQGTHVGYTLEYKDELTMMVFVTTTLMPNQPNDINRNSEKKLIANNFVSFFFNESGRPFKLGSVCGQLALSYNRVKGLVIRVKLSVNVRRSMQEDSNNPYISKGVDRL